MKTTRLLRVLSLIGFLLLLAPFYDSCDGNIPFKKIHEVDVIAKKTFQKKLYDIVVDELSFNGFEMASLSIYAAKDSTFKEFREEVSKSFRKNDWYKSLGIFVSIIFDFIVLFSFSIIVSLFTKKMKLLNRLALTNCILVVLTLTYIITLESSFEHLRQIKWGYYAFILSNVLIFCYSKKVITTQNNNLVI